jgi:hypothetical protein
VNGFDYWVTAQETIQAAQTGQSPVDVPSGTEADPILIEPGSFAYVWLHSRMSQGREDQRSVDKHSGGVGRLPAAVTPTWYLCNNMSNVIGPQRWDSQRRPIIPNGTTTRRLSWRLPATASPQYFVRHALNL